MLPAMHLSCDALGLGDIDVDRYKHCHELWDAVVEL